MKTTREELLSRASALLIAEKQDFIDLTLCDDYPLESFRLIDDKALRSKLIGAGLAVKVQSPKGKQNIASIIRLLPENARLEPTPRRARQALPTIDELEALVKRFRETEAKVAAEIEAGADRDIADIRKRIAHGSEDDLHAAHEALGKALESKREARSVAKLEARSRLSEDPNFEQRPFLAMVAA